MSGGTVPCYHEAAALERTADLISKSDSPHSLIRVLPL